MKDMESRKFEDAFQHAFKEAEVSPSDAVWTNIELDLERAEGGKMKRRILFYKLLAAASVAFAMSVAGIGYYMLTDRQHQQGLADGTGPHNNSASQPQASQPQASDALAERNTASASSTDNQHRNKNSINPSSPANASDDVNRAGNSQSPAMSRNATQAASKQRTIAGRPATTSEADGAFTNNANSGTRPEADNALKKETIAVAQNDRVAAALAEHSSSSPVSRPNNESTDSHGTTIKPAAKGDESFATLIDQSHERTLSQPSAPGKLPSRVARPGYMAAVVDEAPAFQPDPVLMMQARLDAEEKALREAQQKENERNSEKLWTSVGFAAGGFNTVASNVNMSPSVALNNIADQQSKASGVAYTVGVSVGARLSERWVLQGGVNYMTQASDYTANAIATQDFQNFEATSVNSMKSSETVMMMASAPYNVNNSLQFISVPLQAGYVVVNKRIGVQINGGIATDLFLQNTITPESGTLQKTTQGRGADSPYRSLNFSGLVGTEVSYKLGERYRVALNPGLRYPFSSIYKDDQQVDAIPLTFDLGLRFRYIFR